MISGYDPDEYEPVIPVVTETGAVRSNIYPKGNAFPARYELMMRNSVAFRRLAEVYGEGEGKYGPDNWMKGFKESVLVSHALEHIRLHLNGVPTGEDDISHAVWNLMTLMWVQENKPELMDITKPQQVL